MGRKKKEEGKETPVLMEKTYVEPSMDAIREDAEKWAAECGFKGSLRVDGPSMEKYPRYGHGYVLSIRENEGKQRMATARYTHEGKRSFWQMDGMITG